MAELASPALRAVPNLETPSALLFSEDDERSLIGAEILALLPAMRSETLAAYSPEDLADPRCRFVDGIVRQMVAEDVPVDQVTVPQFAMSRGLISPGAPRMAFGSWLAETCDLAPVPASGTWFASVVVELSVRRALVALADDVRAAAEGGSVIDLATVVSESFRAALVAVARLGDR